jgi:AcrR family transcriptional regulator
VAETVNRRSYDNSRREAAARQTRRAVIAAARALFLEQGYGGTALTDVAARAGVSVQTVYGQFGSKRELLKQVVDVSIVGDDEPVALADRQEVAQINAATDPREKCRLHALLVHGIMERVEPVDRVLRSAAAVDPAVDEQLRALEAGRLQGMLGAAAGFAAIGALRQDLSVERAAQLLFTLCGPEPFRRLRVEFGWSADDYRGWLAEVLEATLLGPCPDLPSSGRG